jgi:serine/threonine protein kinase
VYNRVLQNGECDLREYWAGNSSHQLADNATPFWNSMLEIAEAVCMLHEPRQHGDASIYGVHADLKPDNVICVKGAFKVADFGFSTFFDMNDTPHGGKVTQ